MCTDMHVEVLLRCDVRTAWHLLQTCRAMHALLRDKGHGATLRLRFMLPEAYQLTPDSYSGVIPILDKDMIPHFHGGTCDVHVWARARQLAVQWWCGFADLGIVEPPPPRVVHTRATRCWGLAVDVGPVRLGLIREPLAWTWAEQMERALGYSRVPRRWQWLWTVRVQDRSQPPVQTVDGPSYPIVAYGAYPHLGDALAVPGVRAVLFPKKETKTTV